jgi:hypothetical protein
MIAPATVVDVNPQQSWLATRVPGVLHLDAGSRSFPPLSVDLDSNNPARDIVAHLERTIARMNCALCRPYTLR